MQPKRHPPSPQASPPAGAAPDAQPGDPSGRPVAANAADHHAAPIAATAPTTPAAPDQHAAPAAPAMPLRFGQRAVGDAPDGAAFTAIVARNRQDLYAFLRGLLANDELAQDLTQDTFHDAWRAAQRGAPPFASLAPTPPTPPTPESADTAIRRWLFHAAYYKAISARRRWRLIRWESLDLRADSAASLTDQAAGAFDQRVVEGDALRTALARLTPQDAACLLLRVVQGFSAAEVGAITGASAEVVTKRLSRARQRLRDAYLALNAPDDASHHIASHGADDSARSGAQHSANSDPVGAPRNDTYGDGRGPSALRPDAAPKEQAHT